MSLNHSNNVNRIFKPIRDHFENPYGETDQNNYSPRYILVEVFRKSPFNQYVHHQAYSICWSNKVISNYPNLENSRKAIMHFYNQLGREPFSNIQEISFANKFRSLSY